MKFNKVLFGASVAIAGFAFQAVQGQDVQAAEWVARTVEQVQSDVKTVDGDAKEYTVQWGDTLNVIAAAVNADVDAIADLNDIENANLIEPGQKLSFEVDKDGKAHNIKAEGQEAASTDQATAQPQAQATSYANAPAAQPSQQAYSYEAPAQAAPAASNYTGSSSSAKEIIAQRESGGSYTATNGQYIGRYQLSASYLGGDHSPANQERVADQYVASRYGSWDNALAFWNNNGWY
ncbi:MULTISPECIES: LysM domain-containing protein [Aerococcus]|uniref:LysM peptidoglycan-binding domain-containing protein n=1 Tax=Aerococcus sanguinicola TaxID=119206 RepID=A0A5N1GEF7_9LACT|nr:MULTISPECIES: LysM domain-containing protein [Aerococcus]KAA9299287.1 LysM peptidoglycan-binding domain-containing protein [Aerococcus sanguinicola]MDK6370087.1 LysM domain-containing protein [Aerococcus sp. UMB9870]MDK6680691.1 LysM domain-containing protein [Aerococcus sp. UMB8608]MDK6687485.1 LysM domain-containing protein [Aerococcus sp. UMB8623]MDK6940641.1 LysM domain-containing protein [Aerococcus sp. UMB8487]